ncbi:hypothetical protein BO83DRAFT_63042 [Aspergillus eucalypticola CBS 122712]|uniref:Uncharacterized protein n=1 Tax=Aspergillus eucalypticola (strain CBS 122712 / IBT 29274) TaxID=1448314 RepID=A0A317V7J5_ASPEC|nr:uncharacterized protein BO83DRAFT_63042 [Aspergillus eucalypticola CBS 122712]PWY70005.1 hypothetical protein BO83DRAFT_63042 [Aspergillus eucalypticola CBS 122712]
MTCMNLWQTPVCVYTSLPFYTSLFLLPILQLVYTMIPANPSSVEMKGPMPGRSISFPLGVMGSVTVTLLIRQIVHGRPAAAVPMLRDHVGSMEHATGPPHRDPTRRSAKLLTVGLSADRQHTGDAR